MTVEIISAGIHEGIVELTAINVSEEHLQRIERTRDDGFESELTFKFDPKNPYQFVYIRSWLKAQKATAGSRTWGEALNSVVGTITTINSKYRSWF